MCFSSYPHLTPGLSEDRGAVGERQTDVLREAAQDAPEENTAVLQSWESHQSDETCRDSSETHVRAAGDDYEE